VLSRRKRIKFDVVQLHIVGLDCLDPCAVAELMLNALKYPLGFLGVLLQFAYGRSLDGVVKLHYICP